MFKSRIVLVRNWSPGSRSAKLNGSKHIQKHDQFRFFLYSSLCIFTFQIIWEYKHHHENDNIYDSQKLSFQIHETTNLIYIVLCFFLIQKPSKALLAKYSSTNYSFYSSGISQLGRLLDERLLDLSQIDSLWIFMVFNAIFDNISVILWRAVFFLVEFLI